jgi:hypothetical protein
VKLVVGRERARGRVGVVGAGAVSAFGFGWRGLGEAVAAGRPSFAPSRELAASHPGTPASEVPPIPEIEDAGDARQRKLMSRPARLAAIGARKALADAGWREATRAGRGAAASAPAPSPIGYFLGVGASGASMTEVTALLRASFDDHGFSVARCGEHGLNACNPLFPFQILNNFTLCHGAILEGLGGPNAAFYSRGAGTVTALLEAAYSILEGDCEQALAGGADSALHPVTFCELRNGGHLQGGLVPGEGAGLLALARIPAGASIPSAEPGATSVPLAMLEACALESAGSRGLQGAYDIAVASIPVEAVDAVILAPWGDAPRRALHDRASVSFPGARIIDASAALGDALAASPALAWIAALDLLVARAARRVLVLSAGIDGDLGAVVLAGVGSGREDTTSVRGPEVSS